MKEQNQQIFIADDLKKYRIELPNLYDDSDLDPYEFRLLVHYVRRGNCWESVRTTAKHCHISHPVVIRARNSLEEKGWIKTKQLDSGNILIKVVSKWEENFRRYSGSQIESGGSDVESGGSQIETKNKPIKKEPIKNTCDAGSLIEHFASVTKLTVPRDGKNRPVFYWQEPIEEIGDALDWDETKSKSLITSVVSKMDKEKLSISSPKSILNNARSEIARMKRNGGGNAPGGFVK